MGTEWESAQCSTGEEKVKEVENAIRQAKNCPMRRNLS
jgi:hypothetical protein